MPEEHRLPCRAAAHGDWKAAEAPAARRVLAEEGLRCEALPSACAPSPGDAWLRVAAFVLGDVGHPAGKGYRPSEILEGLGALEAEGQ